MVGFIGVGRNDITFAIKKMCLKMIGFNNLEIIFEKTKMKPNGQKPKVDYN